MKFYGHANLQQNELQNAVLSSLTSFPADPKQGQIAFVNSTVYICVNAGVLPVWIPLTREITAYTHIAQEAALSWTISHNLNTTSVLVQVYDEVGDMIIPSSVTPNSTTSVTIGFSTLQSGRAVLVSGHFDGSPKPTYAYTHYQSAANTTWVITHNLGYNPITRVFIGNQEVQPTSITHNSVNQVTITFATAEAGYARLV